MAGRAAEWIVALGLVALAAVRVFTFDQWADGDWLSYGRHALFGTAVAAGTWLLVRLQLHARASLLRALPWLAALAITLQFDVPHLQRITHPVVRSRELVVANAFDSAQSIGGAASPNRWSPEVGQGGSVAVQDGAAVLTAPAGAGAFLELPTPKRLDLNAGLDWLPRGFALETYDESLDWTAAVTLERPFLVMVDTEPLLLQATPYGLHLTFPDLATRRTTEHQIELLDIPGSQARAYTLERADGLIRLRINGEGVWVQPDPGPLVRVRFGETRPSELHGGRIVLDNVRYVRRFVEQPRG